MAIRLFYYLLTAALVDRGVGFYCNESRCGVPGPAVRFPFRLKYKQPDHCGYPGFDLSCTENNTVLELPTSVKLYVESIDYKSQLIYTTDPHGCLPAQLVNLTLSTSPFQFEETKDSNFAIFNCSSNRERHWPHIPCLSGGHYKVFPLDSVYQVDINLLSCKKMYDIWSVPYNVFRFYNNKLVLAWTNPKCGSCERKGKGCRLQYNSSDNKTECYWLKQGSSRKPLILGTVLGISFLVPAVVILYQYYRSDKTEREFQAKVEKFLDDYKSLKPARYCYADLKRITNQFKDELGQGSYGNVYKGNLSSEIQVAVKVLNNSKGNGEEFVNEVGTIGKIHHVHVVRLVGYCADGFHRALVYEYLPKDSLQKFISSPDSKDRFLGWKRLQQIALGTAKGIEYLHQGCDQRILHFDIKPQNILLDDDFNPKISDFGLAKLCSKDKSAVSMTTARGTIGYIAPEVFSRNFGSVSYKSDVYSFGMLVLEMVGGRKNVDETSGNGDQIYFPEWIYNLLEEGDELRFDIDEEGDGKIAKKLAIVGLWCIQWNPVDRPSMKTVVQMLEGEGDNLTTPPNPFSSTAARRNNGSIPGRRLHQGLEVISETE